MSKWDGYLDRLKKEKGGNKTEQERLHEVFTELVSAKRKGAKRAAGIRSRKIKSGGIRNNYS